MMVMVLVGRPHRLLHIVKLAQDRMQRLPRGFKHTTFAIPPAISASR